MNQNLIFELKNNFNIIFDDMTLLETAFLHSSYVNEHRFLNISDNERLEFLGDAVLQLIISRYLYEHFPNEAEGVLSRKRSSIVREESLAGFARNCHFDQYILLGKGEESTGGRRRNSLLCDLFESFLGALLLDQGYEAVEAFIHVVMIPKIEKDEYEHIIDYKTQLQEVLQKNGEVAILYQEEKQVGPAHQRIFEMSVSADGRVIGQGSGKSKKQAEQNAAKNALLKIQS
ncbi:MAG: ribonuclease III [Streptococcaceae bacterium]|jgi:ribonuclease-3|nr:ribonuclease III [Streptococcaceae bacterium]